MDRFLIDISAVPKSFIRQNAKPFGSSPSHRIAGGIEKVGLVSTINLASRVSETAKKFQLPIENSTRGISTILRKASGVASESVSKIIDVILSATYCIGPSGGASVLFGLGIGGGIYGYYPAREMGWYASVGFNASSSAGFAAEMQFTVMFGPPSLLDGISKQIEIDVSVPGKTTFWGGILVFDAAWNITGIALVGGVGFSLNPMPASLTATLSVGDHGKLKAWLK